jgi:putative phosphoesterase
MRIAIFSDIHGNLLALDACLGDLEQQGGADVIIAAGDLVADGPKPKKVVQRLMEVNAQCIRGNTDREIAEGTVEAMSPVERAQLEWTRKDLGDKLVAWLGALPFALRFGEEDNQLLVVHANPTNDVEHMWPDLDDETLEKLIGGESVATTIAFGHLHLPYVRMWRGKLLVNVASAGLPKDGDARAGYAILTQRSGGWEVKHRRVPFDVKRVATQLSACGIPGSVDLIAILRRHRYKRLKNVIP